ncbi:MAG: GYDIA family GHMP kinase [Bacteroidota bacterium]
MKKTFYSNGKLLLTAEYLVLDGAEALALPTKFGQNLIVEEGANNIIYWKSFDADGSIWFQNNIPFQDIIDNKKEENDPEKNTLIEILHYGYLQNPNFIKNSIGYTITTQLTFPKKWGLGTSSTLINNIAQWLEIDAFVLLRNSFGGSGYDIACAQNNTPILFHLENEKPISKSINFHPNFIDKLYFVYLNKKQNSKSAIATYFKKRNNIEAMIPFIDGITKSIIKAESLEEFSNLLNQHEAILSNILTLPTIKASLFPEFYGTIKSLGAWGGDFVLVVAEDDPTHYFEEKGYKTILSYNEMIL